MFWESFQKFSSLVNVVRVVNSGILNDFGIPILVNPEGPRDPKINPKTVRDPEKMAIYLVTTVRLPVQNPGCRD
jgi:hypothetical protein